MSNVLINAPKTAKQGEVIELKALIMHPMETGFRAGANGTMIPRNIIRRFIATWNGQEIFSMAFSAAVAANPFVSFFVIARESGTVEFHWIGDEGFDVRERAAIAVA
jgi:sulfur-oxidizing protein SoxZ